MVAFGHTSIGVIAGIGSYKFLGQGDLTGGLLVALSVGVASHYLTDAIPHGHFFKPGKLRKYLMPVIVFDLLLPVMLFLSIVYLESGLSQKLLYTMFGIAGSQLPDVASGLIGAKVIRSNGWLKAEGVFHEWLHWHGRRSQALLLGIWDIWQVLTVPVALFLIIFSG